MQAGCHLQWGATDDDLYFNENGAWGPYGVHLNLSTLKQTRLFGTVYTVNRGYVVSPALDNIISQYGYGVFPKQVKTIGCGIFLTDLNHNSTELLVSLERIIDILPEDRRPTKDERACVFHTKLSPDTTKVLFVVNFIKASGKRRNTLFCYDRETCRLHVTVSDRIWSLGGHHPNWCPDSEHVIMNLRRHHKTLTFTKIKYDGSSIERIGGRTIGSGHPTMHKNGYILTDAYQHNKLFSKDGTVPLRWISPSGEETELCRVNTDFRTGSSKILDRMHRVDPHPAWSRDMTKIAFNGLYEGLRGVYVGDMSEEVRQ
jgi:hypothetical protein